MSVSECPFCERSDIVAQEGCMVALADAYPVTEGHTLILPSRHVESFFELNLDEWEDTWILLYRLRDELMVADPHIRGFNIGVNCGEAAGQTVPHAHIHFIPRRPGDTPKVAGGVRAIFPDKMNPPIPRVAWED